MLFDKAIGFIVHIQLKNEGIIKLITDILNSLLDYLNSTRYIFNLLRELKNILNSFYDVHK